jgi:two-component system, LytTR family, response regulator
MNNTLVADQEPIAREQLAALLNEAPDAARLRPQRLIVRSGPRVVVVDVRQVDWVQAEGNYVRLHVGEESHLIRDTMHAVETRLGGGRFVRIHRSRIANIDKVRELRVTHGGDYEVVLHTGRALRVSRLYRDKVQDRLRRT